MATYDYKCEDCGHSFEVSQPMNKQFVPPCPKCKSEKCKKQYSSPVGMKGSKEIWDYNDIRKIRPKYLKSKDGKTRVKYDPSKHGRRKGSG